MDSSAEALRLEKPDQARVRLRWKPIPRLAQLTVRTAHGSPRGRTVAKETLFSGISSNESPKLTRAEKPP